jgi:hypothetical protein
MFFQDGDDKLVSLPNAEQHSDAHINENVSGDLELVLLQLDGQVIGHTNLQIDHRNKEERPSDTELALARVDSSVLVVTNTLQDTMPQLYYQGDANQRLQHGTENNIIDVDWKNRLGQDQNHLWRRFHQLSAVDRQHIVNNGLDFQLIPELEEQIHRLAPRASLLDLLQTTRVAGEHLN